MWPAGHSGQSPPMLPLGVHILYKKGDHEELFHLLKFLRSYFVLTEEDFTDANIDIVEKRFPYLWFGGDPAPLKRLIKATEGGGVIEKQIDLGFSNADQSVFRAYREHLDTDDAVAEGLKRFFAKVEEEFFGTKDKLH